MKLALRRRLRAAVALRALTITLTGLILILGALAAHHAESSIVDLTRSSASAMQDAHGPGPASTDESAASADESVFVALAAGCVVLAICCVIALALVNRAHWAAMLARYFGTVPPSRIRQRIINTFGSVLAAPSLFSLSISRT